MVSFCRAEGAMHGSHVTAAAGAAVASSTYPVGVQSLPLETQPKSEGFFGWLPGSGIMNKVIEKTKVMNDVTARCAVVYSRQPVPYDSCVFMYIISEK